MKIYITKLINENNDNYNYYHLKINDYKRYINIAEYFYKIFYQSLNLNSSKTLTFPNITDKGFKPIYQNSIELNNFSLLTCEIDINNDFNKFINDAIKFILKIKDTEIYNFEYQFKEDNTNSECNIKCKKIDINSKINGIYNFKNICEKIYITDLIIKSKYIDMNIIFNIIHNLIGTTNLSLYDSIYEVHDVNIERKDFEEITNTIKQKYLEINNKGVSENKNELNNNSIDETSTRNKDIYDLNNKIKILYDNIKNINNRIDELNKQINKSNSDDEINLDDENNTIMTTLRGEILEHYEMLDDKIEHVNKDIEIINEQIENINNKTDDINKDIDKNINNKIENINNKIDNKIKIINETVNDTIKTLTFNLNNDIKTINDGLKNVINKFDTNNKLLYSLIENLDERDESNKQKLIDTNSIIKKLENKFNENIIELKNKINDLNIENIENTINKNIKAQTLKQSLIDEDIKNIKTIIDSNYAKDMKYNIKFNEIDDKINEISILSNKINSNTNFKIEFNPIVYIIILISIIIYIIQNLK